MKTSIEIEYKTLINKEEYQRLVNAFDLEQNIFHQINYYFDDDSFYLRNNSMALRIRHKGSIYKLTLKRPHEDGYLYEDSVLLTKEEALDMIKNGFKLTQFNLDIFVTMKATLETYRCSTPYKEGKLFLDHSIYGDTSDYEVEYEASDMKIGLEVFHDFLKEYKVPYRIGAHKIDRVYQKIGL